VRASFACEARRRRLGEVGLTSEPTIFYFYLCHLHVGSISVFTFFDGWVATSIYLDQIILSRHQKTVFKTIERSQFTPIFKVRRGMIPDFAVTRDANKR
jgi:hypothetical protein